MKTPPGPHNDAVKTIQGLVSETLSELIDSPFSLTIVLSVETTQDGKTGRDITVVSDAETLEFYRLTQSLYQSACKRIEEKIEQCNDLIKT